MNSALHERSESLWTLAFPPLVWAVHFLLSYCTAAIWCAKFAGASRSLEGARIVIAGYTLVALGLVAACGFRGYRRLMRPGVPRGEGRDTPQARTRFLGHAAMLLSGLSAIAVLYAALVVVFIRSCD
jgi:hypothetical protein